jgi:hypothetical protein
LSWGDPAFERSRFAKKGESLEGRKNGETCANLRDSYTGITVSDCRTKGKESIGPYRARALTSPAAFIILIRSEIFPDSNSMVTGNQHERLQKNTEPAADGLSHESESGAART